MQPIHTSLTGKEGTFGYFRDSLTPDGFTLANWDYGQGYFDRKLDDKAMVFLRIPFEVTEGELDHVDAQIQLGTPFVLKHIYQSGTEENIGYFSSQYAAPLVNQFQEPIDKDVPLDPSWVQKAETIVHELEQRYA